MESFALFANAKTLGKNAACVLTISDSLVTHKETTPQQRQTAFTDMMEIALDAAVNI
jgi:purine-nucleoside phosphorylase